MRDLPVQRDVRLRDHAGEQFVAGHAVLDQRFACLQQFPQRRDVQAGALIRRSVVLGADFFEDGDDAPARGTRPRVGVGRDVVLDRVIVDKNARIGDGARLVNASDVQHADGDGFYIRDGIIVVPKDGTIPPGTIV